jgi:hypothetical protein
METKQPFQLKKHFEWFWLPRLRQRPHRRPYDILEGDLDRALRSAGCALCWLANEHDGQTMRSYLAEHSQDTLVQGEMVASWGACAYHAWTLGRLEQKRHGAVLGLALSYEDLLKHLSRFWNEEHRVPAPPPIGGACRFCQRVRWRNDIIAERLLLRLVEQAPALTPSTPSLCLPHIGNMARLLRQPRRGSSARLNKEERARCMRLLLERASEQITSLLQKAPFGKEEMDLLVTLLVGERLALPVLQGANASDVLSPPLPSEYQRLLADTEGGTQPLGCPLCDLAAQQDQQAIAHLLEAAPLPTRNGAEQLPFASAAWCHAHSWLAHDLWCSQQGDLPASALPAAVRWFAEQALKVLATHTPPFPPLECPVCSARAEAVRQALPEVLRTPWQPPHLLCLSHWRLAWNALASQVTPADRKKKQGAWASARASMRQRLSRSSNTAEERPSELPSWAGIQEAALTGLTMGLAAYIRRFDAYQRAAGRGPKGWEERAWEVVLACFVGNEPIQYPARLPGKPPALGRGDQHV